MVKNFTTDSTEKHGKDTEILTKATPCWHLFANCAPEQSAFTVFKSAKITAISEISGKPKENAEYLAYISDSCYF